MVDYATYKKMKENNLVIISMIIKQDITQFKQGEY